MLTRPASMIALSLGLLAPMAALSACNDDPPTSGGCNAQVPFEDEWRTVFDGPLAAELPGDNAALNVTAFNIGGTVVADNFINRGDVEIYYTLPPIGANGIGEIVVQMKRFTGACDQAEAAMTFESIEPWIYRSSATPPGEIDPALACTPESAFTSGCNIRVYYNGLTQPVRAGADIRVFLPENFRGDPRVITQDSIWPDGSYSKRSDVKIKGLYGTTDIQLESGEVEIELADNILPAPRCDADPVRNADFNQACEDFVDPDSGEPAAWDRNCGCLDRLGRVAVETFQPESANITVDAPADFWVNINAQNNQPSLTSSDEDCFADVRCEDFDTCEKDPSRCNESEPWFCAATTNIPSGAGPLTGYGLQLVSTNCNVVPFHASSERYGSAPESERRGKVTVCSGCLDIPVP